jgi:hypothetical protein
MIKIALRVYDTLEITVGARSLATVELIEVSHREVVGFRAP